MKEMTARPRNQAAPADGGISAPGPSEAALRPGSGKLRSHPSGEWPGSIPHRNRPLRDMAPGPGDAAARHQARAPRPA
jgi:hypothetical protein